MNLKFTIEKVRIVKIKLVIKKLFVLLLADDQRFIVKNVKKFKYNWTILNFVYIKVKYFFLINFMPIIKSAKKRVRQDKVRNNRNKIISLNIKKSFKDVFEAIKKKDKKKSQDLFKICQKVITIGTNRGILKKNKASRKISSLNKKIKAL